MHAAHFIIEGVVRFFSLVKGGVDLRKFHGITMCVEVPLPDGIWNNVGEADGEGDHWAMPPTGVNEPDGLLKDEPRPVHNEPGTSVVVGSLLIGSGPGPESGTEHWEWVKRLIAPVVSRSTLT